MKLLVVITVFVVATLAEPPISKSYLPPSSQGGYSQGPQNFGSGPQVVAARSLEPQGPKGFERSNGAHGSHGSHGSHGPQGSHGPHGHGGHSDALASGFGRSALGHAAQGRFAGGSQGYDHNASPFGRNALEETSEPANYNFGYMVNDYQEGTDFGHHEERQEERAQGEYHVVLPDGRKQTVSYEADERGFKPHITYEDTESDAAARNDGYDSNANNLRSGNDHHGDGHGNGYSSGDHHGNGFGKGNDHHGNGFANGGDHHSNDFANGATRSAGHHANSFGGAARSSNGY